MTTTNNKRDLAPELAVARHTVLADKPRAVGQADDDVVVEAGAFAQFQQVVRPGALDHGAGTDRASGGDHEGKKGSKMSAHDRS